MKKSELSVHWTAPFRRSSVDVTNIVISLYVRNDPIRLVRMVKQAGKLTRANHDLSIPIPYSPFASAAAVGGGRGKGRGVPQRSPLAYQPDSPTARGGGGPERVPKWRFPIHF